MNTNNFTDIPSTNITFDVNNEYYTASHYLESIISDKIFNSTLSLMKEDIDNYNSSIQNLNIIWFIVYMIASLVIYFLIWRPNEVNLAKDFTKTKLLILLIPTNIIMKRYKILDILKKENLISIKK